MPVHDDLGTRMKEFYETVPKTKLMRRTPVAIRLDGKAFHTFTRGFQKPFDDVLGAAMRNTMKYLCKNIQGCVFGYTQSDEITLILVDYQKLNTAAWFDYEVQKMCSIAASMATMAFNKFFAEEVAFWKSKVFPHDYLGYCTGHISEIYIALLETYNKAIEKGAMFDARVFNIPKEEVANLIYWRQLDATRNSIQMVGQANFTHKELQGVSCNQIQNKLLTEKNINWNDFAIHLKRGSCCIKNVDWCIDLEIPIFKGEDRDYIERFIFVGE